MKEMSKALVIAKRSVTSIIFEKDLLSRLRHPYVYFYIILGSYAICVMHFRILRISI
jgi:hypothetical protein